MLIRSAVTCICVCDPNRQYNIPYPETLFLNMFYPNLKHFKCRFTETTGILQKIFHRSSINGKNPSLKTGIRHILLKNAG